MANFHFIVNRGSNNLDLYSIPVSFTGSIVLNKAPHTEAQLSIFITTITPTYAASVSRWVAVDNKSRACCHFCSGIILVRGSPFYGLDVRQSDVFVRTARIHQLARRSRTHTMRFRKMTSFAGNLPADRYTGLIIFMCMKMYAWTPVAQASVPVQHQKAELYSVKRTLFQCYSLKQSFDDDCSKREAQGWKNHHGLHISESRLITSES